MNICIPTSVLCSPAKVLKQVTMYELQWPGFLVSHSTPRGVLPIVRCRESASYFLGVGIGDPVFFRVFFGQNLSS